MSIKKPREEPDTRDETWVSVVPEDDYGPGRRRPSQFHSATTALL